MMPVRMIDLIFALYGVIIFVFGNCAVFILAGKKEEKLIKGDKSRQRYI